MDESCDMLVYRHSHVIHMSFTCYSHVIHMCVVGTSLGLVKRHAPVILYVLANYVLPCGSIHFKRVVSNMLEEREYREVYMSEEREYREVERERGREVER